MPSAILKDPTTYEHVDPAVVGNARIIPMSNQAGQSNLRRRLAEAGLEVAPGDPALARILEQVKAREAEGYSYDTAQASFELLARAELGLLPDFFEVKRYRVTVERRKNKYNQMVSLSEAVVVVKVDGEKKLSVSESHGRDRIGSRPGQRAVEGAGEGSGPLPGGDRRHAAGRFQGAHHARRDRGRDPRHHRQRGRAGAALVHRGRERQHRGRELRGAAGRDPLEADPRRGNGWGDGMTEMEALAILHAEMPRQGPGTAEDVLWALETLGLEGTVRIVDAGCGPGADLETLAQALPEARITGIDMFPHLAEEARQRLRSFPNVTVKTGDMTRLEGQVDLIWCAGALYFLGVTEGLTGWRDALAAGGAVAFSEPVLPEGPRDVAEEFWADYPAITDWSGLEARVRDAGYHVLASRNIVGEGWAEYQEAQAARIAMLTTDADPVSQLATVLAAAAREVALWRRAPEQIRYALVLARPD